MQPSIVARVTRAEAEPRPNVVQVPAERAVEVRAVVEQIEDVRADIDAAEREPPADAA
jgi:hypothetical protein